MSEVFGRLEMCRNGVRKYLKPNNVIPHGSDPIQGECGKIPSIISQ
jgi:hypothetical protein